MRNALFWLAEVTTMQLTGSVMVDESTAAGSMA